MRKNYLKRIGLLRASALSLILFGEMKHFGETNYFTMHAEADETHAGMGLELLVGLRDEDYKQLLSLQCRGWDMLFTVCDRIAELACQPASSSSLERYSQAAG